MRYAFTLGFFVILAGCVGDYQETYNNYQPPESFKEWAESPGAQKGYIFLCTDITHELAARTADQILALDQREDVDRITLLIDSVGGEAGAFRVIHNALRLTTKPVDAVNIGNCYSAACGIFASATGKRYAYANAHFMIHKPFLVPGSPRGLKDIESFEVDEYERVLKKGTQFPSQWFPLDSRAWFFDARQAKEYRLADAIIEAWPIAP